MQNYFKINIRKPVFISFVDALDVQEESRRPKLLRERRSSLLQKSRALNPLWTIVYDRWDDKRGKK